MSDEAFSLPPTPLMTPQKALDVGRAYKALARHLTELGVRREADLAMRDSHWWVTYSIALAQVPPADDHPGRE